MDIHRCRFVPYPPSTINALAFSHSHISRDQKTASPRLAVGRANGDIEIWNPLNGSWLQEIIIRGGKDRSVDGLVWIQDPSEEDRNGKTIIGRSRLFSIGYTTTVTEWDLENGRPLHHASGNHGEIWCLAAQPGIRNVEKESAGEWNGQNLITGCTDGALVLYSTKDEDLQLQRVLVRPSVKKAKIISVVFQDRNIVVAGCTDSVIRVYDVRNGSMLRSMSLGAGPMGGPKEIIIWSVKALPSGNIISGDSTGELRIWDGKTYTLMQRVKGHRQDVLSLAISFDGSTILSGGMDRRTVIYKQVGSGKLRWAEVGHRRYHKHDVKTMASLECKGMSIVVSGGPDASPTVLPLRKFGMENQRALPFLPQEPLVRGASSKRLIMSWWNREIHIWSLKKPPSLNENEETESESDTHSQKLIAKILIDGEANITSAALSTDGTLFAASTATAVKLFQLRARKSENDELKVSKVGSLSSGARVIQISPDGKWLCIVGGDSRIAVARIVGDSQSSTSPFIILPQLSKLGRITRQIEKHVLLGGLGTYDRTVTQVAFSSDSRILAVSDLAGYIDTFVLSGHEDLSQTISMTVSDATSSSGSSSGEENSEDEEPKPRLIFGQHWTRNPSASLFPQLPSAPVVLSFRPDVLSGRKGLGHGGAVTRATRHNPHPVSRELPSGEDRMIVVTAGSEVLEFEVLKGSLTAWSRRNPTTSFPEEFRRVRDLARGCIWNVTDSKERMWLYGAGWLWMFDLSQDFPLPEDEIVTNGHVNGNSRTDGATESTERSSLRKRKRTGKEEATGAGSAIADSELGIGMSRKTQRTIYDEVSETHELGLGDAMDIDEDEEGEASALERLRRPEDVAILADEAVADRTETAEEVQNGEGTRQDKVPPHWHTYKYRPILGMAVIGDGGDFGPEVGLVERPIWETDLPPRYYGDQEWEKGGVW